MKKYHNLNLVFWGLDQLGFAIILTLLEMASGFEYPVIFSFLKYNIFLICTAVFVTWAAYYKRNFSLAGVLAITTRVFVLTIILLPVFTIEISNNYFIAGSSFLIIIGFFLSILVHEIINWDQRLESMLKTGKIVLSESKQKYNVFLSKIIVSGNSKKNYIFSGGVVVVLSQVIARIAGMFHGNTALFVLQLLTLIIILAMDFLFAESLARYINLYRLQRKRHIVLKSEFADYKKHENTARKKQKRNNMQ